MRAILSRRLALLAALASIVLFDISCGNASNSPSPPPTEVIVTPSNAAFTAVGDTARFTAVAKDGGGTPVAGVQVLWSISDNTVATIDTLGLAKSKGPGTALVS